MKHLFSLLLLFGFLLTISFTFSLALAQESSQPSSQPPIEAPKTLEEAKTLGTKILIGFPDVFKQSWHEALVLWRRMLGWFKNLNIWYQIHSFLETEVERRKPEIKEEFEKEKQEMKEDIPEVGKSLWQRFRELIR